MIPREFGGSGIKLSPMTFGSMRLDPSKIELDEAVRLIDYLYAHGVDTFHSSHEYATDDFFCRVMSRFRQQHTGAEIKHIAKIGVPHFGESEFSSDKLITLVENRLQALETTKIDVVQWLVRHQPNEDRYRLPILAACQSELEATWSKLQQQGKVGALASFPYSVDFATAVLKMPYCRGLVTYLNLLELEMVPLLNQMLDAGQGYIAIRPLGGGAITNNAAPELAETKIKAIATTLNLNPSEITKLAIQFPLLHPAVTSVMVSVSNIDHAREIIAAIDSLTSDLQQNLATFNRITRSLIKSLSSA
ncbi:MAG: aldo/keto reductase [Cyanobacteria bacterium J06623_7]